VATGGRPRRPRVGHVEEDLVGLRDGTGDGALDADGDALDLLAVESGDEVDPGGHRRRVEAQLCIRNLSEAHDVRETDCPGGVSCPRSWTCNRWKPRENGVLWAYVRDLYQTPGFGDTVDFDHIKRHYYQVHTGINPTGIVPLEPDLSGWLAPHHRELTREA